MFLRIRVIDFETGGNGPTNVCEIGWQDVISEDGSTWRVNEERGALFVNPGRSISPETMAVHHILDAQVAASTSWKDIAPGVLRPPGGVAAFRASFTSVFVPRNWQAARIGSALGNALFAYGRNSQVCPIRCFDTNGCRMALIITSVCRPIGRCPMPMSPLTTYVNS